MGTHSAPPIATASMTVTVTLMAGLFVGDA
jgi:hypothetical protein